jgi:ribose transport system substrate-binding protein
MFEDSIGSRVGRQGFAGLLLMALMALTACSGSSSSSKSSSSGTSGSTSSTTCGSIPTVRPADSSGELSKLPGNISAWYNGADAPILNSAWSDWKPKHAAPYTVGISYGALTNPFQTGFFNAIQRDLRQSRMIKNVVAYSIPGSNDIQVQLQQYNSLVQQGVDLIFMQPTGTAADQLAIEAAGQAGIPTVGIISNVQSTYVLNVDPNEFVDATRTTSILLKNMKGKGTVVEVHGIQGVQVDTDAFKAFGLMLNNCPNVTVAGEVIGNFAPPAAKVAMLQFLSTHPQKIDAVFQTATMGAAIMQAFQQAGRPVAPLNDIQAAAGSIGYWLQNKGKYHGAGAASGPVGNANLTARMGLRLLGGQGPKLNTLFFQDPLITDSNVSAFGQSSWDVNTPGTVEPPPSAYIPDSTLDNLFNHPENKQGTTI